MSYVPAAFNKTAFHCVHAACGTYAKQVWLAAYWILPQPQQIDGLVLAVCDHCGKYSVWLNQKLLFPAKRTAPTPHPDIPTGILADYEEASAVLQDSPRSSAALLRLAIQKLCKEFGQSGENLNSDIGELVKQGLPIQVQRALDIVRVVGNNQVHPGVLDVRDNPEIALRLFDLVNLIVEDRIARPKQIEAMYASLPENARKQIEDRDGKP
jgi:hypothetical protein